MSSLLLVMAVVLIVGFAGIGIALRSATRYRVLGAVLYGLAILILMVVSLGYTL